MDNNSMLSIRHYAVVHFQNLRSDDEEKILQLALDMGIIPLHKSKNCYTYTFESSSKIQLQGFLTNLRKSYSFSLKWFEK